MPTLADIYEPEHLANATELCGWIHDEAADDRPAMARRGTQVPCRSCLAETEPGPSLEEGMERARVTMAQIWANSDPWGA